jgi:hypothetical protein
MKQISARQFFAAVLASVMGMGSLPPAGAQGQGPAAAAWKLGKPIVTYFGGPKITEAAAKQMADGGFNLVWCSSEEEMDIAQRHGLRAMFHVCTHSPEFHNLLPLLDKPGQRAKILSLDDPLQREKLDALIARLRTHPAFYAYYVKDEPDAADFAAIGRVVAYLRERDPKRLAYVNLFPTYADSYYQLGIKGDTVAAYREYLRLYLQIVQPALISYDNYQFWKMGEGEQYFLNLALVRQAAQQAGLPFMNIVQAASCFGFMLVPTPDQMRYLVYTTLAYGANGISYYVYWTPGHRGGLALEDGTPTPVYHAVKPLNREFAAIAAEYQPLRSLGVYHAGMMPPGAEPLPNDAPFRLDPPVPAMQYEPKKPVKGMLLGVFGPARQREQSGQPTHVLVVNLDYQADNVATVVGPGNLELFDATAGTWSPAGASRAELRLPPGGGKLLRIVTPKGGKPNDQQSREEPR